MQKWEYLALTARWEPQVGWRVRLGSGDKWEKVPVLSERINELGQEGWELVSENYTIEVGWEYTWFRSWTPTGLFGGGDPWGELNVEGKKYKGVAGHMQYIAEIGVNGWELVLVEHLLGVSPSWLFLLKRHSDYNVTRIRFKRPISSP